jgi:hypothetical protein
MRFLKQILLPVILLSGIIATVVYTSCVQNVCNNVSCQNGGSCNAGLCRCPTGYEGNQCQTRTITRYLGTFAGTTSCNSLAGVIDSVVVSANGSLGLNGVTVRMKSLFPSPPNKGYLYGTVASNESAYVINVSNDDSRDSLDRRYTITMLNDTLLELNEYVHDYRNPADTIIETCDFRGYKTK